MWFLYIIICISVILIIRNIVNNKKKRQSDIAWDKLNLISTEKAKKNIENKEIVIKKDIEPTKIIYSKIAGVTHRNKDGSSRQKIIKEDCYECDELVLIPEYSEKYPEAIKICLAGDEDSQLGYVTQRLAIDIKKKFEKGWTVKAHITQITGEDYEEGPLGCNIEIDLFESEEFIK